MCRGRFAKATAADPAFDKPGEQIARPARLLRTDIAGPLDDPRTGPLLAGLDPLPKMIIDDAQVWHLLDNPIHFRI